MYSARSIFWTVQTLVSVVLLVVIAGRLSDREAHLFLLAEFAAFAVAFFLALLLGGPGKILALGIGLAVVLPTVLAGTISCNTPGGDICIGPGAVFLIAFIVVGALYPGWAIGTALGTLARLRARRET